MQKKNNSRTLFLLPCRNKFAQQRKILLQSYISKYINFISADISNKGAPCDDNFLFRKIIPTRMKHSDIPPVAARRAKNRVDRYYSP